MDMRTTWNFEVFLEAQLAIELGSNFLEPREEHVITYYKLDAIELTSRLLIQYFIIASFYIYLGIR